MHYVITLIYPDLDVLYVKRTSRFGPYYGNIVLTRILDEALRFTRRKDALARGRALEFQVNSYPRVRNRFPNIVNAKVRVKEIYRNY